MMRPLIGGLLVFAGVYTLYCAGLYFVQRHLLFPGRRLEPPAATADPFKDMRRLFVGADRTEAWLLPPEGGVAPLAAVVYAHGNGTLIDYSGPGIAPLRRAGLAVLLVEYPGYGRSGGSPSEQSVQAAYVAAYDSLVAQPDIDPARVVFFGHSLGGGAVCALARQRRPAALVLLSTFTSVRPLASRYWAPGFLVRDPFDNLEVLRSYDGPVLIAHGRSDRLVSFGHAVQLQEAAVRGHLLEYPGGHRDTPPDWDLFTPEIVEFLAAEGVLKAGG